MLAGLRAGRRGRPGRGGRSARSRGGRGLRTDSHDSHESRGRSIAVGVEFARLFSYEQMTNDQVAMTKQPSGREWLVIGNWSLGIPLCGLFWAVRRPE